MRPGSVSFRTSVPSRCQISRTSSRGTMISFVPSASRSATAGEPSHASCQRSNSVATSSGAAAFGVPPLVAFSHAGGGSGPAPPVDDAPPPDEPPELAPPRPPLALDLPPSLPAEPPVPDPGESSEHAALSPTLPKPSPNETNNDARRARDTPVIVRDFTLS